jgi:hypothetical protein
VARQLIILLVVYLQFSTLGMVVLWYYVEALYIETEAAVRQRIKTERRLVWHGYQSNYPAEMVLRRYFQESSNIEASDG